MFSRTRKPRNKKNNKKIIGICFIFIIFIIFILFSIFLYIKNNHNNKNMSQKEYSDIFTVDKIVLFSSANATNNETTRNLWNLNIYQFTDIALYINNNNNELTSQNTVKNLYIDNINYTNLPERGSPELYYKNINDFGLSEFKKENFINNKLDFKITKSQDILDTNEPSFYETCQTPITLQFVNKDIKTGAIIPNTGEPLVFDGTLLSKSNIALNNIKTTVTFDIHLTNNLDEVYTYNVNLDIPLEDENQSIYNGSFYKEILDFDNKEFYKEIN